MNRKDRPSRRDLSGTCEVLICPECKNSAWLIYRENVRSFSPIFECIFCGFLGRRVHVKNSWIKCPAIIVGVKADSYKFSRKA